MSEWSARSLRWLTRLLASRPTMARNVMPGVDAALDGATAIALAESAWCDLACLGGSFPASVGARAWAEHLDARNAFGRSARALEATGPRGALASAIGAASAGQRVTTFLAGSDLDEGAALLRQAAARRIPLVVHVTPSASGVLAFAGGHDAWHRASDLGWMQLFAVTAQDAVDLALAARIAAERSLVPVMVATDAQETALAPQDVRLPEPALVRELLAIPSKRLTPPTSAQRVVFGEHRGTVPCWHDLDEPAALGTLEPPELVEQRLAAGEMHFAAHAHEVLTDAMAGVGERTGRPLAPVTAHEAARAEIVLIATGSTAESAAVVAARLRAERRARVGVVEIRQHRPWPARELLDACPQAKTLIVLERTAPGLATEPPLTREVRRTFETKPVRVATLVHGVGSLAAPPHLIAEGCRRLLDGPQPLLRLGVRLDPTESTSPKRRAMLDAARRADPGLRGTVVPPIPPDEPDAADLTLAIVRPGAGHDPFASQAAALVHSLGVSRVRAVPSLAIAPGERAVDLLSFGPGACRPTLEFADVMICVEKPGVALERGRCPRTLLLPLDADGRPPSWLDRATLGSLHASDATVIGVSTPVSRAYENTPSGWRWREALLGAFAAIAGARVTSHPPTPENAAQARARSLEGLPEPERTARLDAFTHGFQHHAAIEHVELDRHGTAPSVAPSRPVFTGRPSHNPAEHWSRVGELEAAGVPDHAADPLAACAVTPAGSGGPHSLDDRSGYVLEFDPDSCDGSSHPWVFCPDGSVVACALGAPALLESAVTLASSAGHAAEALLPMAARLGALVHKRALAEARPPTSIRDAFEPVFPAFLDKLAPPDDRRRSLEEAFAHAMDAMGMLPIARTRALFDARESAKAGSGAFLVLGIDPDATRDARAASPDAIGHGLRLVERTPARLERARTLWRLFRALPDTPGEVIADAADQPAVGPIGAAMLSRSCSMALAPCDDAEAGSGERLALRLALAAAEAHLQPAVQRFVGEIRSARERLGGRVHETLSAALPDVDLDALSEGLHAMGREDTPLGELSARVAEAAELRRVDTPALARLVDAARELADLEWRLTTGPTGLGRARLGAAVACSGATLALSAGPFNPFSIPATIDAGTCTPDLARGLAAAQGAVALEAVRSLRRARLVLERSAEGDRQLAALPMIGVDDLTPEERAVVPPVLLVAEDDALGAEGLGSLLALLSGETAVKVLLLTGGGGRAGAGAGVDAFGRFPAGGGTEVALLAAIGRRAFVAQSSVALPDHLAGMVQCAIEHPGPALVRVHAPSPSRHGFSPARTLEQARLAVVSRAHPVFTFDPTSSALGLGLDLSANPTPDGTWGTRNDPLTPADWAITEARFRPGFVPLGAGQKAEPVASVLTRPPAEGTLARVTDPLDNTDWLCSPAMLAFSRERARFWRTLQELAGLATPFTERTRAEAERAVAGDRERDLSEAERRHAAALAELRAGAQADSLARVRDGLLALAGYGPREGGSA